jgi:N-acetylmuramoyl-L-alanine amidase
MKLKSDKWVPTFCLAIAIFFGLSAYLLYSTEISIAASEILKDDAEEKILFYDSPKIDNLKNRYKANSIDSSKEIRNLKDSGEKYGPIKILIVPGHDEEYSGAVSQKITEAEINMTVAKELYNFLEDKKGIEVFFNKK